MTRIQIDLIQTEGTQTRSRMDPATVDEYAEAMRNGSQFPPVIVFGLGDDYWLADGFHRLAAARTINADSILAEVYRGGKRDAILYSAGSNDTHGLRRTNEDKRRAVLRLLEDEEWSQWSDREIARRAKVSQPFVSKLRQELSDNGYQIAGESRTATRNGVTYTIDTANIGKPQGKCGRCGRPLTDPDSIAAGVGPCCAAHNQNGGDGETDDEDSKPIIEWTDEEWDDYTERIASRTPTQQDTGPDIDAAREERIARQQERRAERIAEAQSLPPKTYNVILADPPWEYSNTGLNGAAAKHYPTMGIDQLCRLPQQIELDIASNAVLFLWVTNPLLEESFRLIHAWGFSYKTNIVWTKDRIGTGFYVRGMHEMLLICVKGSFTPIETGQTPPITSILQAPTQEHSRKPDQVYQIIQSLYPNCNYIELFARRQHPGWDAWGNEV